MLTWYDIGQAFLGGIKACAYVGGFIAAFAAMMCVLVILASLLGALIKATGGDE